MDTQFYKCQYCFREFEPKRRRVQKFCSNTCRSKAHHLRKTTVADAKKSEGKLATSKYTFSSAPEENPKQQPQKVEKITASGIGNATIGTLTADAIKSIATSTDNKPATKGDLKRFLEKLDYRYILVSNMQPNTLGQYPYFDLLDETIVFMY